LPGQGAVWPDPGIQEMRAGVTPRKTIMEDTLARLSLVHEAFDITNLHGKGGHHERLTCSAATRSHRRSPGEKGISRSSLESRDYEVKNKRRCRASRVSTR
jgi:hypothetical protein